jgi:hypothetical protein
MRRILPASIRAGTGPHHRLVLALSALMALTLVAPAAGARIGIPKKVKDVAGKTVEQKAAPQTSQAEEPIVFDEVILELTEDRIAGILAACARVEKVSAARPPLVEKQAKLDEERQKLLDKHEEKIRKDRERRSEVDACRGDGYSAATDRRYQEYSQRALSDPALRDKFMKVAQQYNAAAASGDTVAIRAAQEAMHAEVLPTKEDSVAVNQECGPKPPISAEETKLEAFDKEQASLHEQLRAVDEKITAEQASSKSGFNRAQWGMAVERIQMYLAAKKQKPKDAPRGFSEEEIAALEKRLEELKGASCW